VKRLAWAVVAATLALVVVDTLVSAQYRTLLSADTLAEHAWPAVHLAALASTVMGALIVSRFPRHPIGWLLAAGGSATSLSLALEAVSLWMTDHDGPGSVAAGRTLGWLSLLTNASFTITTLTAIFLIAPDGRLPSRRWRGVLGAAVAGYLLYVAGVLVVDPQEIRLFEDQDHGTVTEVLVTVGVLLTALSLLASLVSLVLRMRRATGVVRQQLRWVVASAALPVAGLAFVLIGSAVWDRAGYLLSIPLYLSYLAVPACIAVAVLHYRLFDLDLIISRALVLGIATVLVGTGYVLVVVSLGSAIGRGTGGFWASLLAFVLVALAFQPLRRRVVHLADRLAFGASATPYETLADLARRLGESPDPTYLLPAVAEAAGTAVSARRTTVRLRVPGAADQVGRWPAAGAVAAGAEEGPGDQGPAGATVEIPVVDRGETLGTLHVEMPPGRDLRQHDSRLLQDLADQSALAFRNARLSAELANQVGRLDRSTEELVESRRRLITAGDAERQRLERSIARKVVPHLEPLPVRLQELAGSAEATTLDPGAVRPLVAESTAALEALREITRGVFPALLARAGLEAALRSLLGRAGGRLVGDGAPGDRLDERVEAAAYFCVAEVLRELSPPVEVVLDRRDGGLALEVRAPDTGGLPAVAPLRDRVETVGGTVVGRTGEGLTVLEVRLPAAPRVEVPA
jgi:GAF domain-containing protein